MPHTGYFFSGRLDMEFMAFLFIFLRQMSFLIYNYGGGVIGWERK